MSTAKKTLYAAIGAGSTALDKARELPQKVVTLPNTLKTGISSTLKSDFTVAIDPREIPKRIRTLGTTVPARASELVGEVRKLTDTVTERFVKTYGDLSKRGEKLARKVQRSAPTKRAVTQTKTAKSKVKAAATSVSKAAEADMAAVKSALAKTAENA